MSEPERRVKVEIALFAELGGLLLLALLLLWVLGTDIANQLGDCVREFIKAKNGLG
jgi:hypothetical protein